MTYISRFLKIGRRVARENADSWIDYCGAWRGISLGSGLFGQTGISAAGITKPSHTGEVQMSGILDLIGPLGGLFGHPDFNF